MSSSLLLFGRYVFRPSSGVCRTREPTRNFELRPLLNPRWSPVLIPLTITGYMCHRVLMTSGQYSQVVKISGDICTGSPTEFNMIKNRVYSILCSSGKIYKGKTRHPLKVRLEEHRKAIVRGEIQKSGMADHIWKEKGNHLLLWDEVEIIYSEEYWRIKRLKESAHMLTCWVDQV